MTISRYVTIPNVLSASRIVFLPLLYVFALGKMELAFVIAYALIGITDLFDGYAARRLNQCSELGKVLDSWADLAYYASSAFFMARLHMDYLRPNMVFLWLFFGLLALSLVVSAIRCGKPIFMHTWVAKTAAAMVYVGVILSTFVDTTVFVAVILAVYSLAFIEAILIFLIHGDVDPDSPSIFRVLHNPTKG
jgi:phosphatidylglycerophosphate synthase